MAREVVRIEGLDAAVRTLNSLPAELVSKRGGPVRAALQKSAKRIQQDEQQKLQQIIDTPNVDEDAAESSGLLKKNIVVKRGRLARGEKGELYAVKIRNKAYPNKKGKRVTTAQVGRQLETGTEKRPPMPFIRPAFEAAKGYVFGYFTAELSSRLDGIVKKLHRANGGSS